MAIYDEKKLRGIIETLSDAADFTVAQYVVGWMILAAIIGAVIASFASQKTGNGAVIGGIIGLFVGGVKGTNAAFDLRTKAEMLACMYQIERNGRSTLTAAAPRA